jgi:hypothetical protein
MIFNNQAPRVSCWKVIYLQDLRMVKQRIRHKYAQQFNDWLEDTNKLVLFLF